MIALSPELLVENNLELPESYRESLDYLISGGYIASVDNYVEQQLGNSDRMLGFYHISQAHKIAKELFQIETISPSVVALRHNLWLEWVTTNGEFQPNTKAALTDLFNMTLSSSETNDVALRHAVWESGVEQSRGMSKMHLTTVEEVFKKLDEQYQSRVDMGWYKRWEKYGDVEVTLNLQEFTDPDTSFDFTSYSETDEKAPYFENGNPPIGGYITTSNRGKTISIRCAYADNRGAMTYPEICDTITVEVIENPLNHNGNHPPQLHITERSMGNNRKYIVLDRDDELINKAKLLPAMKNNFINISDLDLLRMAAFAYSASQVPGIDGDCYVEFSLGRKGFYFNQLNKYEPREVPSPTLFEEVYLASLIVNTFEDISKVGSLKYHNSIPGLIVIGEGIQKLSPTEIGQAINLIELEISKRVKNSSSEEEKIFWNKLIYLTKGADAEHRTINALSIAQHNFLSVPRLPSINEGDHIKPIYREETSSWWIQNATTAGDGKKIFFLSDWPEIPPASLIGPKTHNIERLRKKYSLPTPDAISLTTEMFDLILKANKVDGKWRNLRNIKDPEALASEFVGMQESITIVPAKMWASLVSIIQRQFPNWESMYFVVRSTNVVEDVGLGNSSNFAGSFKSFLFNKLLPGNNTPLYSSNKAEYDHVPLDLYTAILEVTKSAFNPEMARLIAAANFEERQELLLNWKMPNLIMPLINGLVSGVVLRYNPQQNNIISAKQEVVITMQPGLEGGVRSDDERPTLRFVVNSKFPTLEGIKVGIVRQNGSDIQPIALENIQDFVPNKIIPSHILELANTSTRVSRGEGSPQDMEFVIDQEGNTIYTQTRVQQLPKHLR